ncbi:MAG: serine/threonine protein kinase [Deltaproteobacteria bacterium]|nr:serine/threonine protein kinase [Deltaproteobacteria bacterium]
MTQEEPDRRLGRVLAGKYVVETLLGRGGMGVVYRGTQRELEVPVAIKFLHSFYSSSDELRKRFRREAVALGKLRHPGVVSLLDFEEDDGELYLVMELVSGVSFASLLESPAPRLATPRLCEIIDGVLEVLEFAHAAGVIHRDIKPSNVMVLESGRVKVLDFGLARVADQGEKLTATGLAHGTAEYMSPEQCQGEAVTGKTEVYAVGVMLYEALAGRTPFAMGGAAEMMAAHMFAQVPAISKVAPDREVSASLEWVARSALAKDPAQRPTAAEMRASLAAARSGTDPASLAEAAARERARYASMTRSERAMTVTTPSTRDLAAAAAAADAKSRRPVVIDIADAGGAAALQSVLAVAGIASSLAAGSGPAPSEPSPIRIITAREPDAAARARVATDRGDLVIVMHVADATAVAALVKAGAADVVTSASGESELAPKIKKLLRRRR